MRATVRLATVLFIVGVAPRFKVRKVRLGATLLALALVLFTLFVMLSLPRM